VVGFRPRRVNSAQPMMVERSVFCAEFTSRLGRHRMRQLARLRCGVLVAVAPSSMPYTNDRKT
jgi:hypothetical protein